MLDVDADGGYAAAMGQKNTVFAGCRNDDAYYNGEDMLLFWVSGSPACFRAMIALAEKHLGGYKEKHLNFMENEHKGDQVTKWNPRGQVFGSRPVDACSYLYAGASL